MSNTIKGIVSGLVATLILSAIMLAKIETHFVSGSTIIDLLGKLAGGTVSGWLDHFIIGTVVWGLVFAAIESVTGDIPHWLKGMLFGVAAWLVMMLLFLPYMGLGLFDMKEGATPAIVFLVQHLIYGFVLGATYGLLSHWAPVKEPERSPQV